MVCPVCRAKWKEVPWQAPSEGSKGDRGRGGLYTRTGFSAVTRSSAQAGRADTPHSSEEEDQRRPDPLLHILNNSVPAGQWHENHPAEPNVYNDDEPLLQLRRDSLTLEHSSKPTGSNHNIPLQAGETGSINSRSLDLKSFPEVSAVPALESRDRFTLLVHMKAPPACTLHEKNSDARAPIDLVTVLDVSGSMAGTKLALLKQAMGFVVCNLGAADRLSIVVFSSSARRVFPLRRMVEGGRQQVLRAIEALVSTGGTNIAEGLRKGAKVLEDRREKNPVAAIMLLSDGQDTYTMSSRRQLPFFATRGTSDSRRLVPGSIRNSARQGQMQTPVHTFGFGADHDAAIMHTISEVSGGTFSFIQREGVIQDAFAQCIGGLLSVVAQDVQLMVSCAAPGVLINSIHAGSYDSSILDNSRHGVVKLGDLYAEEERAILVDIKLPACLQSLAGEPMALLQAGCMHKDPVTQETNQNIADDLCIQRPEALEEGQQVLCLEVDRQRNRFNVAEVIAKARSMADEGHIAAAQCHLQRAKTALESSPSALAGDHLCSVLEAELSEIQGRMANQQLYERSGRAYILSAQSSHLRQRATTRGESLDSQSHDYQTSSMVDMILQSQTLSSTSLSTPGAFPSGVTRSSRGNNENLSRPLPAPFVSRRASARVQNSQVNSTKL